MTDWNNVPSITITEWDPNGPSCDEYARLLGQAVINGLAMHVEAWAVGNWCEDCLAFDCEPHGWGVQEFRVNHDPKQCDDGDCLGWIGADGEWSKIIALDDVAFQTIEIETDEGGKREYILIAQPHGD